jgi:hypothetical protein
MAELGRGTQQPQAGYVARRVGASPGGVPTRATTS